VAVDEAAMAVDADRRLQSLGLMYNVRGMVNPVVRFGNRSFD
jgi:hypothetical protein